MNKNYFLKWIIAELLLLSILSLSAQNPVDSSRLLRVLTYNIYHGETMKGDFDLDRIASVIKLTDPDLVALQEVDFFTRRAKQLDLATELGQRTGLAPLFGRAMAYDGGEYGEGVLSRFSFQRSQTYPLHAGPGKEPRAALEVCVVLDSGDSIRFIGTHLDHTRDETDRINQARQLNSYFSNSEVPAILAGDLNAEPESRAMEIIYTEWMDASMDKAPTFPSENPVVKIDYVLCRPASRWRLIESRVIADQVASDHCALLSILELLPATGD